MSPTSPGCGTPSREPSVRMSHSYMSALMHVPLRGLGHVPLRPPDALCSPPLCPPPSSAGLKFYLCSYFFTDRFLLIAQRAGLGRVCCCSCPRVLVCTLPFGSVLSIHLWIHVVRVDGKRARDLGAHESRPKTDALQMQRIMHPTKKNVSIPLEMLPVPTSQRLVIARPTVSVG